MRQGNRCGATHQQRVKPAPSLNRLAHICITLRQRDNVARIRNVNVNGMRESGQDGWPNNQYLQLRGGPNNGTAFAYLHREDIENSINSPAQPKRTTQRSNKAQGLREELREGKGREGCVAFEQTSSENLSLSKCDCKRKCKCNRNVAAESSPHNQSESERVDDKTRSCLSLCSKRSECATLYNAQLLQDNLSYPYLLANPYIHTVSHIFR